jgi:hypothetical protein
MEHLLEPFKALKSSLQAYQTFSQRLTTQDGAKAYVQTAFNPLFKKLKEMGAKIREHHTVALAPTTLQEKWQAYQQEAMPSNAQIQQLLRVGLSTLGLEENEDFLAFVGRQQPQAWLYKRLKSYVWRLLILQIKEQPPLAIHQWVDQLLALETQLTLDTAQLQRYKKTLANKQHLAYIQQLIESAYEQLQEKDLAPEALEETLCTLFQANYQNVVFYPQDEIIAHCFSGYFEFCLQQYLAQYRGEESRLTALLSAFATLHTPEGLERFNQLFTLLKTIKPTEKEAIKSHCRHQLGDPRLSHAHWLTLKQTYNETYKTIQYWFNEADFELFFKFVFKDKPDLHGRKACWERYLPYAEDFKIFLPAHELQRFNELKATGQLETELEPWLNLSNLTSFVIKTDKVLIFETRETKNSSYVYDLTALTDETQAEQTVQTFVQTVFNEKASLFKRIDIKYLLARNGLHPDLAPDGKGYYTFPLEIRHYRFTHDPEGKWRESVRQMMHQIHGLAPQNLTP